MQVHRISALSDNYIFLLHDPKTHQVAVVDPAEARPVLDYLEQIQGELVAIFNTHHHWDHVGGNSELMQKFPNLTVYGGAEDRGRIPGQEVFLEERDRVNFAGREGEVFFVPGHTKAHIAYYFPPTKEDEMGELFCGDTLFAGGCGRLFEGTPTQMVNSLSKLRQLPDATRVWCAHEYTLNNYQFALQIAPNNQQVQERFHEVQQMRKRNEATIPSTLELEKRSNLFLHWDDPALQSAMGTEDAVQTFARLRGKKDSF